MITSYKYHLSIVVLALGLLLGMFLAFSVAEAATGTITSQLDLGSRGNDVILLQTFLAENPSLYPEGLVTGYYGPLTARAVTQFQLGYGIPPVGRVGPMTLAKINSILAGSGRPDVNAPQIYNVSITTGTNDATIRWATSESARGRVYYDTNLLSLLETSFPMTRPSTSGSFVEEQVFSTTHSVVITGLLPSRTYYYAIHSSDLSNNYSVTLPVSFVTK